MYHFRCDPGPLGVGVAFSDAIAADGSAFTLGGAHGTAGRPAGISLLETDLGVPVTVVRQVHGAEVLTVDSRSDPAVIADRPADALITADRGIGLAVRAADCVPVLFAAPHDGVIGAAHAGRVGLAAGVLQATVAALRARAPGPVVAWIGPHICGRCYEVPTELADEVDAQVPGSRTTTAQGTPGLDLGAGAHGILERLGVRVNDYSACTRETATLHSYRRDGVDAGRQAGIIWLA